MSSVKTCLHVLVALLALLALTVAAAFVNLGWFNTPFALLISLGKGALIVFFFMNMRRETPLVRLAGAAGLFWLGILMALAMSDYLTRFQGMRL